MCAVFFSLSLKLDSEITPLITSLELKASKMKIKMHVRSVTRHLFQNFVTIESFINVADSVFSHNLKVSIKSFEKLI